jgi:hypothetical protein
MERKRRRSLGSVSHCTSAIRLCLIVIETCTPPNLVVMSFPVNAPLTLRRRLVGGVVAPTDPPARGAVRAAGRSDRWTASCPQPLIASPRKT